MGVCTPACRQPSLLSGVLMLESTSVYVPVSLCGCQFAGYTFSPQGGMGGDILRGHIRSGMQMCIYEGYMGVHRRLYWVVWGPVPEGGVCLQV